MLLPFTPWDTASGATNASELADALRAIDADGARALWHEFVHCVALARVRMSDSRCTLMYALQCVHARRERRHDDWDGI